MNLQDIKQINEDKVFTTAFSNAKNLYLYYVDI